MQFAIRNSQFAPRLSIFRCTRLYSFVRRRPQGSSLEWDHVTKVCTHSNHSMRIRGE
jgi:hypothetical protein